MIIKALQKKYEAEIASAQANIQVYLDHPVGIGEHPDLVAAVDHQVQVMAESKDKLDTIEMYYGEIKNWTGGAN